MEGCEESGALDGGADGGQQQGAVVSRGGQPSRVTLAALLAKEAKGFTRGSGGVGGAAVLRCARSGAPRAPVLRGKGGNVEIASEPILRQQPTATGIFARLLVAFTVFVRSPCSNFAQWCFCVRFLHPRRKTTCLCGESPLFGVFAPVASPFHVLMRNQ